MLKAIMRLLIILTIITTLTIGILLLYNNGRTYFNDDTLTGNTIGNIYNGGLFCERDGKIFFSNDKANGSLYVMNSDCTNIQRLHNDKAVFINVDDNYIYYVRANDTHDNNTELMMFYNTGVFRIKRNGSDLYSYTGKPCAYLFLNDNDLFFQKYDIGSGLSLYKNKIDGKHERLLIKDAVIPALVMDDKLYYAGNSATPGISTINLKSFTKYPLYEGSYYLPIFKDEYIYYIDTAKDNKIYRMLTDGSSSELMADFHCRTYNISDNGKYLYYQVDDGINNGIYRIKTDTFVTEQILPGDYKQIHITAKYVFFKDYDNSNTYVMNVDGINNAIIFDPEPTVPKKR